jgi:hypothetical protein
MNTKSLVLVLLAAVFLLCGANNGDPRNEVQGDQTATSTERKNTPSGPVATLTDQPHPIPTARKDDGETYNYHGNFNYIPDKTEEGYLSEHATAIGSITAILIVILTGGSVYVGKKAADAARSSADAARDQLGVTRIANEIATQAAEAAKQSARIAELALKSDRSYILIDEIRIIGTEPPPARTGLASKTDTGEDRPPISCSVRFKNSGRGTARIMKIVGKITVRQDWPEENVRGTQTQKIEKGALPAGEPLSFEMIRDIDESLYLDRKEFDALDDGEAKLMVYGSLIYADVGGDNVYFTHFAWHFSPWSNMMRMFKNGTPEWHGEGSTERGPDSLNKHT